MAKIKDVEFQIDLPNGETKTFDDFRDACAFAVTLAASGWHVNLDVLIYSKGGARRWGGEHAVEEYEADPDASISQRLVISVDDQGRIA